MECQDFLQRQLDMTLEKCKTCDDGLLKLVVPLILQYVEEFTQCEILSRKLVFQVLPSTLKFRGRVLISLFVTNRFAGESLHFCLVIKLVKDLRLRWMLAIVDSTETSSSKCRQSFKRSSFIVRLL